MLELSKSSREIAQGFEQEWYTNPPADLASYLETQDLEIEKSEKAKLIWYMIQIDFEMRSSQKVDHSVTVAFLNDYARQFPDAFEGEAVPYDLIIADYHARVACGQTPDPQMIAARFLNSEQAALVSEKLEERNEGLDQELLPEIEGMLLLRKIGQGGMGTVYSALDSRLGREVAVKLISPKAVSPETILRFDREARILAKLDREQFLPIYEIGTTSKPADIPFYSMRLIRGDSQGSTPKTLSSLLREESFSGWDLNSRLTLFKKIVNTVALAHAQSPPILHRDLKPANILIDENQTPWVIDWGLAKIQGTGGVDESETRIASSLSETLEGNILGTPPYMSPEQANGWQQDISTQTDVFGLGAILCEMLIGRPPYRGPNAMATVELAQNCDCTEVLKEVDDRFQDAIVTDMITKSLAKKPSSRLPNAEALAEYLEFWFDTQSSRQKQREIHRWQAPFKKTRKYLIGLVAVLVVVASAGFVWRWMDQQTRQVNEQDAISKNADEVETELQSVEQAVFDWELDKAERHLSNADRIIRPDAPETTIQSKQASTAMVELARSLDAIREERLLLMFSESLSAEFLDQTLKDVEAVLSELDTLGTRNELLTALKRQLFYEVREIRHPLKSADELIQRLESMRVDSLLEEIQRLPDNAEIVELTKVVGEITPFDMTPGILTALASKTEDEFALLKLLDAHQRDNFWVTLFGAILHFTSEKSDIEKVTESRKYAVDWARRAHAIRPKSQLASFVYAELLGINDLTNLKWISDESSEDNWIGCYIKSRYQQAILDSQRALEFLHKAADLRGDEVLLKIRISQLHLVNGDFETAERTLLDVSETNANSVDVLYLRSILLFLQLKYEEGFELSHQLAREFPTSPKAKSAIVIASIYRGRFVEADEILRNLTADGITIETLPLLPIMEIVTGRSAGDGRQFDALKQNLNSFPLWLVEAVSLINKGDLEGALESLSEVNQWLLDRNVDTQASFGFALPASFAVMLEPALTQFDGIELHLESLDSEQRRVYLREISETPIVGDWVVGNLVVYLADYCFIRGNYPLAAECFELLVPRDLVVDPVAAQKKLLSEFNDCFGLGIDFSRSLTVTEYQAIVQAKVESLSSTEQLLLLQQAPRFLDSLTETLGPSLPSLGLFTNLRIQAARAASMAASGVSSKHGRVGSDAQRNHWRELATQWLEAEVDEVEIGLRNLEQLPQSFQQLRRTELNYRLSIILLHEDFSMLREASFLNDLPTGQKTKLESFWRRVNEIYDQSSGSSN